MKLGAAVVNYGTQRTLVEGIVSVTKKTGNDKIFEEKKSFYIKPGETIKKIFGEIPASSEISSVVTW